MRWLLIAFFLLSGTAHARDCKPPRTENEKITGLRAFSDCLLQEVADLKREQADLETEIENLQKSLKGFPGELSDDNGRVTRLGGGRLTQASFSLASGTRDSATELDIDQDALEELCAIGCTFTLVLTAGQLRDAAPAPVFAAGPCAFRYNPKSGVWGRSGDCGAPVTGIDGNGKPTGNSGGEVIAASGDACVLADSIPGRSVDSEPQALGRDRAKGLFLIADARLWKGTEDRFSCDLKITR
jgi:hypothetical protein